MEIDVVFAVEDPGAVNFVLDMPEELKNIKISAVFLSFGTSHELLAQKGVASFNCRNIRNVEEIFERFSFRVLVVGTSQNSDSIVLELIQRCKLKSIPTIGVIDMAADSDLRFKGNSQESLFYAPDYLIVPDEDTLNNFVELGFDKKNIFKMMHPSLIRLRNRAKHFSKKDIKKKRNLILKIGVMILKYGCSLLKIIMIQDFLKMKDIHFLEEVNQIKE